MPSERREIRTVTDPRPLRALAHPLRLELLDLLDREGELTATRASQLTGHNSANCSFHLRHLAKHGFVEQAEASNRRERPWRRVAAGERVATTGDAQLLEASAAVGELILGRVAAEAARFLRGSRGDLAWQDASFLTSDILYLSEEELRELGREVGAAIARRAGRTPAEAKSHRDLRPVRAAAALFPLEALE